MNVEEFTVEDNLLLEEFAAFVQRKSSCSGTLLAEAAKLALGAVQSGHSCCDLLWCGDSGRKIIEYAAASGVSRGFLPGTKMLFLDDNHLYLTKNAIFEERLAEALILRNKNKMPQKCGIDMINAVRRDALPLAEAQKAACMKWLNSNFAVITGGAGTGKTTIAATAAACEFIRDPKCRVVAVTPTGKAKSRFLEAIAEETASLHIAEDIKKAMLAIQCHTIESLIGISRNRHIPLHNREFPLEVDLLIVDETSMGSLIRLSQLVYALPDECRVVFMGDANQLFSVEAGSVFAEICATKELKGNIAVLTDNFRSKSNPRLVNTAAKISDDRYSPEEKFAAVLEADRGSRQEIPGLWGSFYFTDTGKKLGRKLPEIISKTFSQWSIGAPETLSEAVASLEEYKILTPVLEGEAGVHNCNNIVSDLLGIKKGDNGYPVMITGNDYRTGLSNGDCGVFWGGVVHFPALSVAGGIRSFNPAELPQWECAWCMTIHKSQGSGFKKVLVILPEYGEKLLCCELFYTAITRSKQHISIIGSTESLKKTLSRRMMRFSGLQSKISRISADA